MGDPYSLVFISCLIFDTNLEYFASDSKCSLLFFDSSAICTSTNHSLHSLNIISGSWECLIKPMGEWSKYWFLRRLIDKFINISRFSRTMMSIKIVCSHSPSKQGKYELQCSLSMLEWTCAKYFLDIWKLNWKIPSEFHHVNYVNSTIVIKKIK